MRLSSRLRAQRVNSGPLIHQTVFGPCDAASASSQGSCRIATEVRTVLRHHADGGVFRGFSEKASLLTREPLVLRDDVWRRTLTFSGLLPGVARGSPLAG
jgi:hypothetical protein